MIFKLLRHKLVFLLLLACCISPALSQEQTVDACVTAAAKANLPDFVARIPDTSLADYGFSSRAEAQAAIPGRPIRLHTIHPTAFASYVQGDRVDSLLSLAFEWYVPIMVNSEPRAILIVQQSDSACAAVSFGMALLTRQMREAGFHSDSDARLVLVRQAREYFIADDSSGSLRSLRPPAIIGGAATERVDDVVTRLKAVVNENVRGWKQR